MRADCYSADFRTQPYWWDAVPRPPLEPVALPERADVLVIGAGYTGLHAALVTARAGRSTLVLDAEQPGFGCSTRNGGQISTSIKPDFATLAGRHGAERALAILHAGRESLAWTGEFVSAEGIECGFKVCGRFHAAHSARSFRRLVRGLAGQPADLARDAEVVPRTEQYRELGSDAYHGGVVYPRHAALDPARYHQGLLERVRAAEGRVIGGCPVLRIDGRAGALRVLTAHGSVLTRALVVATNAYTGAPTPWLRRRLIPIGSHIIATEPLAETLMARLMPADRVISDTRRVVYYYRASPDRSRILFGGRVAARDTDARVSGLRLHRELVALFPELAGTRISHSWGGLVAYTFDTLPHAGVHEGAHYALGYCGSGVGMASYLGMRTGQRVLRLADGRTAFDDLAFPTRPLYRGRPWFLPAVVGCYRALDRWVG